MAFSPYTGNTFTTKAAYNAKWDYQNLQHGGSHIVPAIQSPRYPQNHDPSGEADHLPPLSSPATPAHTPQGHWAFNRFPESPCYTLSAIGFHHIVGR